MASVAAIALQDLVYPMVPVPRRLCSTLFAPRDLARAIAMALVAMAARPPSIPTKTVAAAAERVRLLITPFMVVSQRSGLPPIMHAF